MKKVSIVFALIAMMLFVYGCGKEDSSPKGNGTPGGTESREGDTGRDEEQPENGGEEQPDTGGGEETPDTGDGEETPDAGGDVTPTDTGLAMTTYKYARAYIEIKCPKGWKKAPSEQDGVVQTMFTPGDDKYGPAEILIAVMSAGGMDYEKFARHLKDQMLRGVEDADFEDRKTKMCGLDAIRSEGTFTLDGKEKKGVTLIIVKDDFGYMIRYINSPGKYDMLKDVPMKMGNSLKFLPRQTEDTGGMPFPMGDLKRRENQDLGCAMAVPEEWTKDEQYGYVSAFDANNKRAAAGISCENVQGNTLQQVVKAGKDHLRNNIEGYEQISEKAVKAGDLDGHMLIYEFVAEGNVKGRSVVAVFVKGNHAYYVECAYTAEGFDKLLPTFKKMIKSFEITGEPRDDGE